MGTTLITQDLLEYASSLPAGFYSISTVGGTPNAIGVAATGYILRRTGVDAIVALYGISSGTLNVNHYDGHTWLGWLKYTTNTDLTERFKPIRIFGTEGGTFSKALKNKVYNSVVFLAFDTSVPDNPFSFEAGYAIAFHAGLLKSENVFTLIGFDSNALHPLEIKMLDLRS